MICLMTRVFIDDLYFPEALRWYGGRLWFSDFYQQAVFAADSQGNLERILDVPAQPSGLGWLPDGRLLVVSMLDRQVLRREHDGRVVHHADLSGLATFHCNDMLVDAQGRAYVGNFGFDLDAYFAKSGAERCPAVLVRVDPDGGVAVAADDLMFPNGMALTRDGRTLIVAETLAWRLTAFTVDGGGGLSERRVWADLRGPKVMPDGICIDAEGAIWTSNALAAEVLRVAANGAILERIPTTRLSFACALGGDHSRTLFIATAESSRAADASAHRSGRIEAIEVKVPAL